MEPITVGYADPPYPGQGRKHYRCDEVDHAELIDRLVRDYPANWHTLPRAALEALSWCV